MTSRPADYGLPVVRVRRIGNRRGLVRRRPWFEVELTPVGAVGPAWVRETGDPQSLLEPYLGVGDAHAVVAAASRDANDGSAPWRTLFPGDERLGVMASFEQISPTTVRVPSGAVVRVEGRTGVTYDAGDGPVAVDSEMLAPPMSIAVYAASIVSTLTPADDVLAETVGALEHLGFTVEIAGPAS